MARSPHAGLPFDDDDAAIAAHLQHVSPVALLCSLVHLTGDPSWVCDRQLSVLSSTDFAGGLSEEEQAAVRAAAVPVLAAHRDAGCPPVDAPDDLVVELMSALAGRPLEDRMASTLLEDLQFDGVDRRAVDWAPTIPEEVRAGASVVVIGAGMAGIQAGIRLTQAGLPFTILEKNDGPGGTWWENRYPGARVDVGSHQYCFAFAPSEWSEYYCRQPELRDYFTRVLDDHGLRPRCRFGTAVTAVAWDDATQRWRVSVTNPDGSADVLEARFVISAVGSLNLPKLPDIPGMDDFAGPAFHSARWPEGLDLAGTRFALIGAGASGFQIAPTIAPLVDTLTIYQRTAQWMFPNPVYRAPVPAGERWAVRHVPYYGRWMRFLTGYPGIAIGVRPYRIDPTYEGNESGVAVNEGNEARREQLTAWIASHLEGRPDLIEKSVPDYPASGKRILQDDGFWLQTLRRPNVELVRTGIDHIEADAVVTVDGERRPADVICYATGFRHNDFLATMEVTGRDGRSLREHWGDEPSAYLGVTVPGFPNLFCVYGPGTNLAHSASLFFHAEYQVDHALDCIRLVLAAGASTVEVRPDVHDDYADRHQAAISSLVWAHPSIKHSHYKNRAGKVFTLSPWSIDEYWEMTRHVRPEDYEVR